MSADQLKLDLNPPVLIWDLFRIFEEGFLFGHADSDTELSEETLAARVKQAWDRSDVIARINAGYDRLNSGTKDE